MPAPPHLSDGPASPFVGPGPETAPAAPKGQMVNIHEAKTHLSRLIEAVAQGETFIIAKAGKPVAKLTALDAPAPGARKRLGFMAGAITVPDDFDRMGGADIAALFEAG